MKKVIVIGCSGSGKSTFSRALQTIIGLPIIYLDMIWHKSDKTTVSREEFDKKHAEALKGDSWIIDGNYSRTLEPRIKACDTVFLFDLPPNVCLEGVISRMGKPRVDMPWIETERDEEFMEWISGFSKNSLPRIYELLEQYGEEKNIVVFKSREDADKYLQELKG